MMLYGLAFHRVTPRYGCSPFDKLRVNGKARAIGEPPFVLSLSKHERGRLQQPVCYRMNCKLVLNAERGGYEHPLSF